MRTKSFYIFFLAGIFLLSPHIFSAETNSKAENWVKQGTKALHANQVQAAKVFFQNARKADPRFAPAYVGEAEVLTLQNAWDEAFALLDRAIDLAPRFGVAYYNRGLLYYYRNDFKNAYADLNHAMALGETVEPDVLNQVWGAANPQEVIKIMTEQISTHPKDGQAYFNRGIAHFYKNNFQATLNDWKKAKALGVTIDAGMWQELERQINMEKGLENAAV